MLKGCGACVLAYSSGPPFKRIPLPKRRERRSNNASSNG
jgi:hypothetical protein